MTPKFISKVLSIFALLLMAHFSIAQTGSFDSGFVAMAEVEKPADFSTRTTNENKNQELAALHTNHALSKIKSYIIENISYSELMKTNGEEGEIIAEFIIAENGKITTRIYQGLNTHTDRAVLKSLQEMGDVNMGEYKGARRILFPITFSLR